MLVWEPGQKVPIYAFPREDVAPGCGPAAASRSRARGLADPGLHDVDASLLAGSGRQTGCPCKGFASYRDVRLNGRRHRGLFWSYQTPFREVTAVKGYLAPDNERVDLIVDGHPRERPAGPLGPPAEPTTSAA